MPVSRGCEFGLRFGVRTVGWGPYIHGLQSSVLREMIWAQGVRNRADAEIATHKL